MPIANVNRIVFVN